MWYILTKNIGKRNYTVHKDPLCKQLMKFGSPKCKLPKKLTFLTRIDGYKPCTFCATAESISWWQRGSEYFTNHPEKLFGYKKVIK